MDLLERYLGYENWTLRHMIERCRELSPDQMQQPFDIGPGTIEATLAHILHNLEVWTDLMRGLPVSPFSLPPIDIDAYLERFDSAMEHFASCALALAAEGRLDDIYVDTVDQPPTTKTFGGTLLHVLTHTTVHRWEIQHMLQRLGLSDLIEGDALGWELQKQQSIE